VSSTLLLKADGVGLDGVGDGWLLMIVQHASKTHV